MEIDFVPLRPDLIRTYISVGRQAYNEHYVHLWHNGDTSPYITSSFTKNVVEREYEDPTLSLYVIQQGKLAVGILKFIPHKALDTFSSKKAFHIEKIYLLKRYSGMGLGAEALRFTKHQAREMNKDILWLDTMQNGRALSFYQKNGFVIHRASELSFPGAKASEKAMWILIKKL